MEWGGAGGTGKVSVLFFARLLEKLTRAVEKLLAERSEMIRHEAVRQWCLQFSFSFA